MNVYVEDDYHSSAYTDKPYIMGIEFEFFDRISEAFLGYVRKQMEEPERRACNMDDLTIEDLEWLYGTKEYDHPKCLKIYKWSR